MRDDLLQPAFAIYNSPGVYALLLGSGVSRSAEIMTGWDIMKELINQIAAALGETIEGDPEKWYREKFKNEAGYDRLLEHLGGTPLDRNAILRDYLEPSAEDREEERKLPTPAHKAIAWLVEKGYVRVILTTNFDRLIETALQERGIVPDIISTDTDIVSARPLQHSPITIIKIHGDYRDEITKNTKTELAEYSDAMKQLLQRIFSEYGLVVSGWSGDWDAALRSVIENAKSKYATYWSWYSEPTEVTKQLITSRTAYQISSIGADVLFDELQKMVEALEGTKEQPPLNIAIAVERTKKMILRPEQQIELEELFVSEAERAYQVVTSEEFARMRAEIQSRNQSDYLSLWNLHYKAAEIPLHMAATICFYGNGILLNRLHPTLKRWASQPKNPYLTFRLYPTVLLMYSAGISAVYQKKWSDLLVILSGNDLYSPDTGPISPLIIVIKDNFLSAVRGDRSYGYTGQYLGNILRPIYQSYIPDEEDYFNAFDLFETLMYMFYLQLSGDDWLPGHSPLYENRSWNYLARFWQQGKESGGKWGLLTSGLFGNAADVLTDILKKYVELGNHHRNRYFDKLPNYGSIYDSGPIFE